MTNGGNRDQTGDNFLPCFIKLYIVQPRLDALPDVRGKALPEVFGDGHVGQIGVLRHEKRPVIGGDHDGGAWKCAAAVSGAQIANVVGMGVRDHDQVDIFRRKTDGAQVLEQAAAVGAHRLSGASLQQNAATAKFQQKNVHVQRHHVRWQERIAQHCVQLLLGGVACIDGCRPADIAIAQDCRGDIADLKPVVTDIAVQLQRRGLRLRQFRQGGGSQQSCRSSQHDPATIDRKHPMSFREAFVSVFEGQMTPEDTFDKAIRTDQLDHLEQSMPTARLDHLEVFIQIIRCGGFRAAAAERGVSSSVISQTMHLLERDLGVRLLNRTTRSVAPTDAGQRLLDRIKPAINDIRLALTEVDQHRTTPSGTLRINAPGPAVDHVLCPLALRFMQAYPEVKVEIVSDAALVDIVDQGYDAGVRFGEQLSPDMIAIPLGQPLRYAIVAAPAYLAQHGTPQTPSDLIAHDCIRRRYPGGKLAKWEFRQAGQSFTIQPEGRLTLSSAHQELQAALAGHGIAHVFEDYARASLKGGTLVEILADWSPQLPSWYLYYPSRRHNSAAMRAFLDYVRQSSKPA